MTIATKPLGESLGWRIDSASEPFACSWFAIHQFELTRSEQRGTYAYVEHPGSALVVPMTPDGNFLLQRTYRFTTDSWSWEVPAGTLGDRAGLEASAVAIQELDEELGAVCESLEPLGTFGLTNGSANHKAHFFLARNAKIGTSPHLDHLEEIGEVREFSRNQVLDSIWNGTLHDGDSVLALLLACAWLDRQRREAG
jgi:ADP-ribose pyrophosphatase